MGEDHSGITEQVKIQPKMSKECENSSVPKEETAKDRDKINEVLPVPLKADEKPPNAGNVTEDDLGDVSASLQEMSLTPKKAQKEEKENPDTNVGKEKENEEEKEDDFSQKEAETNTVVGSFHALSLNGETQIETNAELQPKECDPQEAKIGEKWVMPDIESVKAKIRLSIQQNDENVKESWMKALKLIKQLVEQKKREERLVSHSGGERLQRLLSHGPPDCQGNQLSSSYEATVVQNEILQELYASGYIGGSAPYNDSMNQQNTIRGTKRGLYEENSQSEFETPVKGMKVHNQPSENSEIDVLPDELLSLISSVWDGWDVEDLELDPQQFDMYLDSNQAAKNVPQRYPTHPAAIVDRTHRNPSYASSLGPDSMVDSPMSEDPFSPPRPPSNLSSGGSNSSFPPSPVQPFNDLDSLPPSSPAEFYLPVDRSPKIINVDYRQQLMMSQNQQFLINQNQNHLPTNAYNIPASGASRLLHQTMNIPIATTTTTTSPCQIHPCNPRYTIQPTIIQHAMPVLHQQVSAGVVHQVPVHSSAMFGLNQSSGNATTVQVSNDPNGISPPTTMVRPQVLAQVVTDKAGQPEIIKRQLHQQNQALRPRPILPKPDRGPGLAPTRPLQPDDIEKIWAPCDLNERIRVRSQVALLSMAQIMNTDEDGDTILHILVAKVSLWMLLSILDRCKRDNKLDEIVNRKNNLTQTPLFIAALEMVPTNASDLITILLHYGADPTICTYIQNGNIEGRTFVHPIHHVASKGNAYAPVVRKLLSKQRMEQMKLTCSRGYTALHHAAAAHLHQTPSEETIMALLENGSNINAQDGRQGCTPLHIIIESRDVQLLRRVLEFLAHDPDDLVKSAINIPRYDKDNALHIAAALSMDLNAHKTMLTLLMKYGGDASIRNGQNKKPCELLPGPNRDLASQLKGFPASPYCGTSTLKW